MPATAKAAHKRKLSEGKEIAPGKAKKPKTTPVPQNDVATEATGDAKEAIETDSADAADNSEPGKKVPLGKGPHAFLLWADELLYIFDAGAPEQAALRLEYEVLAQYELYKKDKEAWDSTAVRFWELSLPENEDAGSSDEGEESGDEEEDKDTGDEKAKLGGVKGLRKVYQEADEKAMAQGRSAWWWVLSVQRDEPEGDVPKMAIALDGTYGGGTAEDSIGSWWVTDIVEAKPETDKAISKLINYLSTNCE
ncbi:hypothetical protein PLICRDRAFT_36265 [Plicaturopsis crispa FD-325 SS-3]|nr:hypothetical protein PLICRDRAFT_36265 [Plicaturopsis crispa FD-325 SS-3]